LAALAPAPERTLLREPETLHKHKAAAQNSKRPNPVYKVCLVWEKWVKSYHILFLFDKYYLIMK
jgi:hypothetical protein